MEIVKTTHLGNIRKANEDAYLAKEKDGKTLLVIADGMGGHNAGEVASEMAVKCVSEYVFDHLDSDPADALCSAVAYANKSVFERAKSNSNHSGMGTTITAAWVEDNAATIANVGDSRTYLFSGGILKQVTCDHSYVQQLVARGVITPEEAKRHPRRNLITRAVGTMVKVKTDVFRVALLNGDMLLLCSDGLTSHVDDEEISDILKSDSSLNTQIDALEKAALAAGGSDNITVILLKNSRHNQGK